ncbi:hypothetical protein AVEN_151425-1, partial [Araneus ventricosus]
FNNIARALAKIDRRLTEIERNQKEILEKLSPNHSTAFVELPSEIKLPCESLEDVNKLEEWLTNEDNVKALDKGFNYVMFILETVRRNRNTATATDDEIYGVMASWFRFCKDRDGGRHLRTKNSDMNI